MRASVCAGVFREANASDDLVWYDHQGVYHDWNIEICLEVQIEVMIKLLLISPDEVGSNVVVFCLFPAIGFLFVLMPHLLNGVDSFL